MALLLCIRDTLSPARKGFTGSNPTGQGAYTLNLKNTL